MNKHLITNLRSLRPLAPALAITAFLLAAALPAWAGTGNANNGNRQNPRVLPPQSTPHGQTYGEWAAAWWQWAFSLPVTGHPLFDETGADAANGQAGPVWFLGGVFNTSGSATRNINVPPGKTLFFPILNLEWDNAFPPILSEAELRANAAAVMDTATDLACEIDDVPVQNLQAYRFQSPLFAYTLPDEDNLLQFFGYDITGTVPQAVDDGYYLMLAPLSRGQHTLHFHGTIAAWGFTLDLVYHITVE